MMAIHQIYCSCLMWLTQGRLSNPVYGKILKSIYIPKCNTKEQKRKSKILCNPSDRGITNINIFLWTRLIFSVFVYLFLLSSIVQTTLTLLFFVCLFFSYTILYKPLSLCFFFFQLDIILSINTLRHHYF